MDMGAVPPQLKGIMRALGKVVAAREPAIRGQVEELVATNPGLSADQLARLMIRRTRRRVAASAAASGAAAIVPGLGTVLSLGTAAGQSLYALEQEVELVMAVSILYGHELQGSDERLMESLLVVGLAGGAVKLRDAVLVSGGQQVTVAAFRRLPAAFMARAGSHVLGRVVARIASTRAAGAVAKAAPLAVGMAAGAGFDWFAVTALGRAAVRYYGRLPAHGAPHLPPAQQRDRVEAPSAQDRAEIDRLH
jgi:hypothetical protein